MTKTILLTGATDGIGLQAARELVQQGHRVLLHGRSKDKLNAVSKDLGQCGEVDCFQSDLSDLAQVEAMVDAVKERYSSLDIVINNAGVLKTSNPQTASGLDVRFVVNTLAPYLLSKGLLPLMDVEQGRIINLSSAAQAPVSLDALQGKAGSLTDMDAYAQSKLAITMWSCYLGLHGPEWPCLIALNPGSLLATKMVKEGFGIEGKDLGQGSDIIIRAALSEDFIHKSGSYFDNDSGDFGGPHPDALDKHKCAGLIGVMDNMLS